MLTETEYRKYTIFSHGLSIAAREYLTAVRTCEPARMVGTHARSNVCSWIVSKKMGNTVATESRTAEKAFLLLCEYDDRVIEIWDQPQPIKISRTNKNGVVRAGQYTPDFMILTEDGPQIIEVKTEGELNDLLERNPSDWRQLSDGVFEYTPAMVEFSKMGLNHKVFSYSSDLRFLVENLELLMRSRGLEAPAESITEKALDAFGESFVWSLYDLKQKLSLDNYTSIIRMVDDQQLFFSMKQERLSDAKGCFVARNEELLEPARELRDRNKIYVDHNVATLSVSLYPPHDYAEGALSKLRRIEEGESSRNVRRWKALLRAGENDGLSPFQSLISKRYLSGNRRVKINSIIEDFLQNYLMDVFAPRQGLSIYRGYADYCDLAKEHHPAFDPVTRNTFTARLRQIPASVIAFKRGGKRAANAAAEPTDPNQRSLKAQLAWQTAAVDHYLADIYLIYFSNTNTVYVMRPWVTAMIDLATSSVLAITISFKDPSRRSVAKVMRECVRRHGKLPNEIIVDRGSDFTSVYFSALLAHYGVDFSLRPSGHSRYGGEVEGFFGEFKKAWLTQREGNLTDFKEARSVEGKKAPKKSAILHPYDFYRELKEFCNWRDNKCRGFQDKSSFENMSISENDYPFLGVEVEYNDEFLLATAVDSTQYKIDFQRGLHVGDSYYWHPDIGKVRGKKKHLEVRVDPENPNVVYALIDNAWVSCGSTHINAYSAKDPVSQFVDGLLRHEAAIGRSAVKAEADENLARIIREMDVIAEDGNEIPVVEIDQPDEPDNVESIFDKLKTTPVVTPITLDYWSA